MFKMAVGHSDDVDPDSAVEAALEMVCATEAFRKEIAGRPWRIRIGVHTGPVIAGVIGTRKFVYDVWGDTVNVASRLENSSEPNQIHVSASVASALRDAFELEPRGTLELKGKGETETFFLRGQR